MMVYPPFATRDVSAPLGWSGYDVELLLLVADLLNVTIDTIDATPGEGEGFFEELERVLMNDQADVVASWWTYDLERIEHLSYLRGHVENSRILVAPSTVNADAWEAGMTTKFDNFLKPFTYPLWAIIVIVMFLSGLVNFALEIGHGGRLSESLRSVVHGALYGGFEESKSRASGLYQVVVSFTILIFVASYTANTAAFLTAEATSHKQINSHLDLINQGRPACVSKADPVIPIYKEKYSDVMLQEVETYAKALSLVSEGLCAAAFIPLQTFNSYTACDLANKELLVSNWAGWVTTPANACVRRAIEWALEVLNANGELNALAKRLLFTGQSECAEETSDDVVESDAIQLDIPDFLGLFCIWLVASIGLVTTKFAHLLGTRTHSRSAALSVEQSTPPDDRRERAADGVSGTRSTHKLVERMEAMEAKLMERFEAMEANSRRRARRSTSNSRPQEMTAMGEDEREETIV